VGPPWALAFVSALSVTLVGTPLLRTLAKSTDFVDKPAERKSHHIPVPYLGGVGLVVAVVIGLAFAPTLSPPIKVIALGGPFIAALGLLDDHRTVNPYLRFAVELGVAALALAAGVRVHATDVAWIDSIFTLVWIVGITNAVNFLDNMDGLSAGVAAAGALGILALAILGEQVAAAVVAAGLVGACLGFLAYNRRPASIFMGDSGSLFLGFVLAVMAIEVSPALSPPASFAVPVILLALPVLDTSTVMLARMRRGRSVLEGGKDHLSHRLHRLGLSQGRAVGALIAAELAVAGLAVLAGRDLIPLAPAVVGAVVVLGVLVGASVRAKVYEEQLTGLPRRVKLAALTTMGTVALLAAPAVVALLRSIGPAQAGSRAVEEGLASLAAGDGERATFLFNQGGSYLRRAEGVLDGPITSLSLAVPVVRSNLSASRTMVATGRSLASEASRLATLAEAANLRLGAGSRPAAEARRLAPDLAASASVLQQLAGGLQGADRPYLWPSLKNRLDHVRSSLSRQAAAADRAAEIARAVPGLLGAEGSRRYFVAIQDNSELRGTGGVIWAWAELAAEDGRLQLTRVGSTDELNLARTAGGSLDLPDGFLDRYRDFDVTDTWQNVNVSPDFSVTAQVISSLYRQSGGRELDGVIAVDLQGFAALVGLTGPLQVVGWPEPVTAANAAEVVTFTSRQRFPEATDRQRFLSQLASTAMTGLTQADPGTPRELARSFRDIVDGGHLLLYGRAPAEQQLFRDLGVAGELSAEPADSLMVVNQNLTATPIDSFLRREVRYDVALDPGRHPAAVTGSIAVTLRNEAPSTGLPSAPVGPGDGRFATGENRTYLSLYTPSVLGGGLAGVRADSEFGRRRYSTILSIGPQQSKTVSFDVRGRVALVAGWYVLDIPRQARSSPDEVRISLTIPGGWRITDARGMQIVDPRHAVADLSVTDHQQVAVRLKRTAWSRLWYRGRR